MMKNGLHNPKDFYAGLFFIFFGVATFVISRSYAMGTTIRMGPGYFPTLLGGILTLLGLMVSARALWVKGEPIKAGKVRPVLLILVSIVAFAYLLERIGLVLASFLLIMTSSLGGGEFRFREVILFYLILTALSVAIFIYGLGLPFKVWPV
jgi:hypothetical protein